MSDSSGLWAIPATEDDPLRMFDDDPSSPGNRSNRRAPGTDTLFQIMVPVLLADLQRERWRRLMVRIAVAVVLVGLGIWGAWEHGAGLLVWAVPAAIAVWILLAWLPFQRGADCPACADGICDLGSLDDDVA